MFEYIQLPKTIRYDLPAWPGFYVLAIPSPKEEKEYLLYLTHENFGVIHFMFGGKFDSPEELTEIAHFNAPDYMADFVKDCCTEETE